MTIDGTALFGTVTADKLIYVYARPFLDLPEGTGTGLITRGNLTFGSSYNQGGADKFLAAVSGTTLTLGGSRTVDASGYPTTFDTSNTQALTKQ